MNEQEHFIAYIKDRLELHECSKISVLNEYSSNLLLVVEDEGERYIVKKYNSKQCFELEVFVLQNVSDLKVPQIIYYERQNDFGWNWIVYSYIEGDSLYSKKSQLDINSLLNIFYQAGSFLKLYHQNLIANGVSLHEECRLNLICGIEKNYFLATRKRTWNDLKWTIFFMRNTYDLLEYKEDYTLTIKDFTDKHILIKYSKSKYCVSGVVDFEMARFSHKYSDFVLLYVCYFLENKRFEDAFFGGYGLIMKEKERAIIAFFVLQYALELCGALVAVQKDNEKWGLEIIHKVRVWLDNKNKF